VHNSNFDIRKKCVCLNKKFLSALLCTVCFLKNSYVFTKQNKINSLLLRFLVDLVGYSVMKQFG